MPTSSSAKTQAQPSIRSRALHFKRSVRFQSREAIQPVVKSVVSPRGSRVLKALCTMVLVVVVAGIGFWATPALSDASKILPQQETSKQTPSLLQASPSLKSNPYLLGSNPYLLAPNPYLVLLYPHDLRMNPYFTQAELDAHHQRTLKAMSTRSPQRAYTANRSKTNGKNKPFEFRKVSELKPNPYLSTASAR